MWPSCMHELRGKRLLIYLGRHGRTPNKKSRLATVGSVGVGDWQCVRRLPLAGKTGRRPAARSE